MSSFDFVLGNRYRLLSPLGEGGMASVYTATDERLGRRVAVKVLADSLTGDLDFIKRFQQEAESAAKLSHPNIVSVYDVGQDGDRHYIVMELVAGRNLKEIIQDKGGLAAGQTIALGGQMLEGLAFAHSHGLIHRDIKPQNILVTREGTAKLADFGIAKAVDVSSATQTAVVLGSAHYLSPEQAGGEPVSKQSDLYSAGVVLYEMCTGVVPFDGMNLLSIASRHLHDLPQAPSSLNPEIPASLDQIILRSLAKNPLERFETASEMRDVLLEIRGAEPEPLDLGRTQKVVEHPAINENQDSVSTRPAVFGYWFSGLLVAIAALVVNRGSSYLPGLLTRHLDGNAVPILSAILGGLAVFIILLGLIERVRHQYQIDRHAVTVETGFISRHRYAIPLPAIVNLQLHQNPMARVFKTGTIVLSTVQIPGQGPASLKLRDVSHASDIYDLILRRIGGGARLRYDVEPAVEDLRM